MISANKLSLTKLYGFILNELSPLKWATAPVDYEAIDQYSESKQVYK